jgi:hypothetical protein
MPVIRLVDRDREARAAGFHQVALVVRRAERRATHDRVHVRGDSIGADDRVEPFSREDPDIRVPVGSVDAGDKRQEEEQVEQAEESVWQGRPRNGSHLASRRYLSSPELTEKTEVGAGQQLV